MTDPHPHILGNRPIAVLIDEGTPSAVIAAYLDQGATVTVIAPSGRETLILDEKHYREPRQQRKPKPERHWLQQHPTSPRKSR